MTYRGLFVGLITLDLVYRVESIPQPNQKCVALESAIAAGGPATNAAVTFSALGNEATILGGLGQHPIQHLIRNDLSACGVVIADLLPEQVSPPPASSIMVTASTGDRAVVSLNAVKSQAQPQHIPTEILDQLDHGQFDIVLIDGHQMAVGEAIAQRARSLQIPVVVDGGSWKPNFETVLRQTDVAICSANFYPPDCSTPEAVMLSLSRWGIPHRVITRGEQPMLYQRHHAPTALIATTPATVRDTLGAGDAVHGAFCHYWLERLRASSSPHETESCTSGFSHAESGISNDKAQPDSVREALQKAGAIAAQVCQSFGTRHWLQTLPQTLSEHSGHSKTG